ncbi:MAG TPA: alpha/beta hydrolase domain-containing protein [Acidimicrobiales bacterium]|nr:alpha/beta hydrolase domain-containing protein [Acidimicrobiales bacterium]
MTGPVVGGQKGRPWSLPLADLAQRGYVAEEFFLAGTAVSYRMVGGVQQTTDGRWDAEPDAEAPFRSRILVVRPADPDRFNGTVVLSWLNVTAGYELGTADDDELLSGYAWVGVSAQKVGIDGFPPGAPAYRGRQAPNPPLKAWDPDRYGALEHPGDQWSFDIFTQAARAVGPGRDRRTDPMGGHDVRRLVATGASQSGARLTTYINAVHPVVGVFDAFLVTIAGGRGSWLGPPPESLSTGPAARLGAPTRIRDDITTPVMHLNSECEAVATFPSRREDDDHFRFWEVAGAPHVVAVVPATRPAGRIDNPLSYRPVQSAAYRHLNAWMTEGTPPPVQPRIAFGDGPVPEIERDANGNALGGIRLPEMEAPTAEYHGRDEEAEGLGALYGWARPFGREELRRLYPSAEAYVEQWSAAVDNLVSTGALRPEDAEDAKGRGLKVAADLDL